MNIPVFLSSDNNYAPFVATTIASICDHTDSFIDFYVLDGGITQENRIKIEDIKHLYNNFSIEFIKINVEEYFNKFIETPNFTRSMYNRFLIPSLKSDIDKAIYTDVDVIFFGNIRELFEEDLENYALGAVWEDIHEHDYNIIRKKYLDLSNDHKYFSSGNLLISCKKWRDNHVLEKLMNIRLKENARLLWPDQDILNKYFENNYKLLDNKYCFIDERYNCHCNKDFIIRHYTAHKKPWKISPDLNSSVFPDTQRFWHYMKMTKFYNDVLKGVEVDNRSILKHRAFFARQKLKLNQL